MKKLIFTILTFLMVFCLAQTGSASILYTATDNGGGNYTLDFEVVNTWGVDIEYFQIYFGQTYDNGSTYTNKDAFSNFSPDATGIEDPTGWWSVTAPYTVLLPGYYESEGDADGDGTADNFIAAGATKTGFNVSFNMDDPASYAHLFFEVGTMGTNWDYEIVATGYTEPKQTVPPQIPEPATFLLFGFGLLGTAAISRKKRS